MSNEIARQYRVARQMVDMHARLRDRYQRRALILDVVILAGSVLFLATTFADSESFQQLGLAPLLAENLLRVGSVVLFFSSVVSLRVGWKAMAQDHESAVVRMARLVSAYREARQEDGWWSPEAGPDLHHKYSEVTESIVPIPTKAFPKLKAKYLAAKEVSRFLDQSPGQPYWVASLVVWYRSMRRQK